MGGFSQGGAVSLAMLKTETKLGGIVALSTYLMDRSGGSNDGTNDGDLRPVVSAVHQNTTPIFQAHGDRDMVVRFEYGTRPYDALTLTRLPYSLTLTH